MTSSQSCITNSGCDIQNIFDYDVSDDNDDDDNDNDDDVDYINTICTLLIRTWGILMANELQIKVFDAPNSLQWFDSKKNFVLG